MLLLANIVEKYISFLSFFTHKKRVSQKAMFSLFLLSREKAAVQSALRAIKLILISVLIPIGFIK